MTPEEKDEEKGWGPLLKPATGFFWLDKNYNYAQPLFLDGRRPVGHVNVSFCIEKIIIMQRLPVSPKKKKKCAHKTKLLCKYTSC